MWSATAAALVLLVSSCGGSGGLVVQIGSSSVTRAQLDHWESVIGTVEGSTPGGRTAVRARALELLILSGWLSGEAHEEQLGVSAREVRSQLELLRSDQRTGSSYPAIPQEPELRRLVLSSTLGTADRLWLMRMSIQSTKIAQARSARARQEISRSQIAAFYRQHKLRFFQPAARSLKILGNHSKAIVVRAKHEIEAGKPFLEIARRVSTDGEAPEGLQRVVRGTEEPPFEHVIFAAKPNVLTGPNKYQYYYLFEVLKTTPAHQQTVAQAEPAIRTQLALGAPTRSLIARFEAKWAARTRCRPAYIVPRCKQHA
jgi:hypothetical protein